MQTRAALSVDEVFIGVRASRVVGANCTDTRAILAARHRLSA